MSRNRPSTQAPKGADDVEPTELEAAPLLHTGYAVIKEKSLDALVATVSGLIAQDAHWQAHGGMFLDKHRDGTVDYYQTMVMYG